MGDAGFVINGIACVLIIFFNIFFCFPYAYPVEISAMNCEFVHLGTLRTALMRCRELCHPRGCLLDHRILVACAFADTLFRTKVDGDLCKQLGHLEEHVVY
jgi:hypothetical protein